jgi:hypothetical protein
MALRRADGQASALGVGAEISGPFRNNIDGFFSKLVSHESSAGAGV